jgi:photosystem II stability/assembly factor-like uncharacterized protein
MAVRRALLAAILPIVAGGCFDWSGLADLSAGAPDDASAEDLAAATAAADLVSVERDGATPSDLAAPPDAAAPVPDLSATSPSDLAGAIDLARTEDLAPSPPDLAVAPRDLAVASPDGAGVTTWTRVSTTITDALDSVFVWSPSNVWVVGPNYVIGHYDGGWNVLSFPTVTVQFPLPQRVLATSAMDAFICTNNGAVLHSANGGGSWIERDLASQELYSLFANSAGVWAIGTGLLSLDSGGDSWAPSLDGSTVGAGYGMTDVWGSGLEMWTAGGPTLWHTIDGANQWHSVSYPVPAGTTAWGNAIWGSSTSDVYLVGEAGYIWHYNGTSWANAIQPVPLPQNGGAVQYLRGVWGTGQNDVYVVGDQGTLLRSTDGGQTWKQESTGVGTGPSAPSLYAIHGAGGVIYAVGDSGLILRKP